MTLSNFPLNIAVVSTSDGGIGNGVAEKIKNNSEQIVGIVVRAIGCKYLIVSRFAEDKREYRINESLDAIRAFVMGSVSTR